MGKIAAGMRLTRGEQPRDGAGNQRRGVLGAPRDSGDNGNGVQSNSLVIGFTS